MLGALTATLVGNLVAKDRIYRAGLILAVVTTLMMGLSADPWIWAVSRFVAGFSMAAGLLIVAGLMLNWLIRHHYRSEMGIHFAGIGLGIVLVALLLEWTHSMNWSAQWLILGCVGTGFAVPAWRWLPSPDTTVVTQKGLLLDDKPPSKLFLRLMLLVYFCAGFGFVISATYIVAIVENQPALDGQGEIAFLILGVCTALPSWVL